MAKVLVGQYYRNKHSENVRKVIEIEIGGCSCRYLYFGTNSCDSGQCLPSAIKAWGTLITEQEALAIIPNIADLQKRWHNEQEKRGERMMRELVRELSDDELMAECQRRKWNVVR